MKVFAIVALCLCGFVFDWINDFLCWIGLPFWVANIVPVLIIGWIIEVCSARTANRAKGRNTYIFIDEIYLLFQYEYSADILYSQFP